jgi:ATP-dependent RNA helicase RhlE
LLHNPERIEVTPPNTTVERIEQRVYRLAASHKRSLLAHLITQGAWEQVLVFTRTKHGANRLAEYLDKHGLSAVAIHGNKSQNARTKALADFKAGQVRILVATDIAARGLDIDQLPHVVNFELPNVDEDYVHRIGRTGRAGRSGEAISLVAPDEEKLLKSIERMTRQKIADGDLMGFDASTVEAEKPEVRERPQANKPRNARAPRAEAGAANGASNNAVGRKDKGKDKGKEKPAGARSERQPRDSKPRQVKPAQAGAPSAPVDRAPDEFRDDEIDNFGNRADYVSPYQGKKDQNRGRRPGAAPAATGAAPAARQGRPSAPRSAGAGTGDAAKRTGGTGRPASGPRAGAGSNGAGRDGQARREGARNRRPARDEQPMVREEPAVKNPSGSQPKIVHKESKIDRFPTPEQLDDLPSRPRGEKPALLTRNREG